MFSKVHTVDVSAIVCAIVRVVVIATAIPKIINAVATVDRVVSIRAFAVAQRIFLVPLAIVTTSTVLVDFVIAWVAETR